MEPQSLIRALTADFARYRSVVRRRVASEADAEDVLQSALLRAAERASTLQAGERVGAWFYRILRNSIADHHRARPHDPLRHREGESADHVSIEAPENRSSCRCAMNLLASQRPDYAEALRRVDLDGDDVRDVARELGISPGNLHVRLHRARQFLQSAVRKRCGVDSIAPCLNCSCDKHSRCGTASS